MNSISLYPKNVNVDLFMSFTIDIMFAEIQEFEKSVSDKWNG